MHWWSMKEFALTKFQFQTGVLQTSEIWLQDQLSSLVVSYNTEWCYLNTLDTSLTVAHLDTTQSISEILHEH